MKLVQVGVFQHKESPMGKNSQYRHSQIHQYIVSLAAHASGEEPIPSERVLAEMFSTTRETVRVSLTRLVEEKYLLRFPRRGYFLNPSSSNDFLRKRKIIGVLLHNGALAFYDEGILRILRELFDAAVEHSWLIQMIPVSPESLVSDICNTKLDGLIWLHADGNEKDFSAIARQSSMPMVGLFNYSTPDTGNYIYLNHYNEFYLRTEYLLSCGCRKIVTGNYGKDCLAGYKDALRDHKIPFDPALVFPAEKLADHLEKIREQCKPDAFSLRMSDFAALTDFAQKHSLDIPGDIQVIIDDSKMAADFTHTVKPVKKVIQSICHTMDALFEGKNIPKSKSSFQWTICKGVSTKENK